MTRELALAKLREINRKDDSDREYPHIEADMVLMELLRALGYEDVVVEYQKIHKWYA